MKGTETICGEYLGYEEARGKGPAHINLKIENKGRVVVNNWGEKDEYGIFEQPVKPESLHDAQVGALLEMNVTEGKPYNNIMQYNLDRAKGVRVLQQISLVKDAIIRARTDFVPDVPKPPDWEAKDRRIAREAAVKSAVEYMKIVHQGEGLDEKEVAEDVERLLLVAGKFEAWYYRSHKEVQAS